MNERIMAAILLSAFVCLTTSEALAQNRPRQSSTAPERESQACKAGVICKIDIESTEVEVSREEITGTGLLLIAPIIDAGYLQTKPASKNVFSRLETAASGWIIEPKLGLGVFSKRIGLDVLVGVQSHSVEGKIIGTTDDYEATNASTDPVEPNQPYSATQLVPLLEGNARIRLGSGQFQAGVSATALFNSTDALFSSVKDQGLNYGVLVGPQMIFENRFDSHFFRVGLGAQFLTTGNQRNAMAFKFALGYSFLVNSPYLKTIRKKTVESRTQVRKNIIIKREQKVNQKENARFIFNSQLINFKLNSAELTDKSYQFVSGLGGIFAAQHSDWEKLVIEGHTDSQGNSDYNRNLSLRRANTVRDVLIKNGVPAEAVRAVGLGEEQLLVKKEKTPIDFAKNRRVEIKLEGVRDALFLQRAITNLRGDLFGRRPGQARPENPGQMPPDVEVPNTPDSSAPQMQPEESPMADPRESETQSSEPLSDVRSFAPDRTSFEA